MTKRIIVLLMLGSLCARAQEAEFAGTTNGGTVTITNYLGTNPAVTIPTTLHGLPVTSISYPAFFGRTNLVSVTIPQGVRSIENAAFARCSSLRHLAIPDSVTNIGATAFSSCTSLTNITLPDSVVVIGCMAFRYCSNLTNVMIGKGATNINPNAFNLCPRLEAIHVDPQNSAYRSVDGVLFDQRWNMLVRYPSARSGSYTIPDGVAMIRSSAFSGSDSLTKVTIPASVTGIDWGAFSDCPKLTGIYSKGDAPRVFRSLSTSESNATVYYLPGTKGWEKTFGDLPTAVWTP